MTPNTKLTFQLIVSLAVILPFWGFVAMIFFFGDQVDSSWRDTIQQITGGLLAAFGLAIGFWLGTSLSSASKDNTISQLTTGAKQ